MDERLARAAADPRSGLARWVRLPDGTMRAEAVDRIGLARLGPRRTATPMATYDDRAKVRNWTPEGVARIRAVGGRAAAAEEAEERDPRKAVQERAERAVRERTTRRGRPPR